mmetsp:Transcript_61677/g.177538  ORF Transcript_61677/g.177538 Transcript_61677/m.177538 type:complete len:205 (-) Transcript_61677:705-1319(-)
MFFPKVSHRRELFGGGVDHEYALGRQWRAVDAPIRPDGARRPQEAAIEVPRQIAQGGDRVRCRVDHQHGRRAQGSAVDQTVGREHAFGPLPPTRGDHTHGLRRAPLGIDDQHRASAVRGAIDLPVRCDCTLVPLALGRAEVAQEPRRRGVSRVDHEHRGRRERGAVKAPVKSNSTLRPLRTGTVDSEVSEDLGYLLHRVHDQDR